MFHIGGIKMARDRFGFGNEEVSWDDPWGDNISIPHKGGQRITGPEADKYSPYGNKGFQSLLYKGHTFQRINRDNYSDGDIQTAIEWYTKAAEEANRYLESHASNPQVVSAQQNKLKEVQFVMQQLRG